MARISFPWLRPLWKQLAQSIKQDTLPHGIGIEAKPERGSDHLIEQMIRMLLCQKPVSHDELPRACGVCKQCLLVKAGSHPDVIRIEPEPGKQLGVDMVRSLSQFVQKTAAQGGNKVVVIRDAERMTPASANSLLKTLEEPPAQTFIILSTHRFSLLLPTIRSRLMMVTIPRPSHDEIRDWFFVHGEGAKLKEQDLDHAIERPLTVLQEIKSGQSYSISLDAVFNEQLPTARDQDEAVRIVDSLLKALHQAQRTSAIPSQDPIFQSGSLSSFELKRAIDSCYQAGIVLKREVLLPGMNAPVLLQRWIDYCHHQLTPYVNLK